MMEKSRQLTLRAQPNGVFLAELEQECIHLDFARERLIFG
jgi:hypothetical protein